MFKNVFTLISLMLVFLTTVMVGRAIGHAIGHHELGTTYHCEILYSQGRDTNAPDMVTVGIDRNTGTLYFNAHGGEDGSLRESENSQMAVDSVLIDLLRDGKIVAEDVKQIIIICCYPGCHPEMESLIIDANIKPFSPVKHVVYGHEAHNGIYVTDSDVYYYIRTFIEEYRSSIFSIKEQSEENMAIFFGHLLFY